MVRMTLGKGARVKQSHLPCFVVRCWLDVFPRGGQLGAIWAETCWHVVGGRVQVVAGCGCKTARHSACLKQANTSRQGQNLQGRWAAGWAQLNAVEAAQSSSHQQERGESEVEAKKFGWGIAGRRASAQGLDG